MKKRIRSKNLTLMIGSAIALLFSCCIVVFSVFLFFEGKLIIACILIVGIVLQVTLPFLVLLFKRPYFEFYENKAKFIDKCELQNIEFLYSEIEKIQLILIPSFRQETTLGVTQKIPCFVSKLEILLASNASINFDFSLFTKIQMKKIIGILNNKTGFTKDYVQLLEDFLKAQANDTVVIRKLIDTNIS